MCRIVTQQVNPACSALYVSLYLQLSISYSLETGQVYVLCKVWQLRVLQCSYDIKMFLFLRH
jgi:hypothetical protein